MSANSYEYQPKRYQAFSWAFGNFGNAIMTNILNIFVIGFYLNEILVQPSNFDALFVTIVTFSGKFTEGLMNVPVARISDNIRTRFGRRRVFFLLSPLWVMFFVLTFACPFNDGHLVLIWLLVMYTGFRWTNAAVVNPYLALLPEIAPDTNERTIYNAYRTFFILFGTILGVLLYPILRGVFAGIFGEGRISAFYTTLPVALFAFLGMVVVFFGVRENEKAVPSHFGMIESFKKTFANKSFWPYLATVSAAMLAEAILLAVLPMIATNYIGLSPDDIMVSLMSGIFVITAIVAVPIVTYIANRKGKARTYFWCQLFFGILAWLLVLIGQIPGITPENTIDFIQVADRYQLVTDPTWQNFVLMQTLLTIVIVGMPVGGIMVLQYSIFSDVIDYDEKLTGQRRESMYFAAQGVVDWIFAASGDLILGLLLTIFGREFFFPTIETETGLLGTGPIGLLLTGPVAGTILIISAFVFLKYPFMEKKESK
ncbi:MAG: MFS transporter [Candidatus Hodarchaeales archaeon]